MQKRLEEEGNEVFHFIFIGTGAEKANLLKLKEKLNLSNVTMLDCVSKSEVKKYISILDVALINLRKSDLFKTVIPSKIFENAGMRIPILMGVNGEAQEIVEFYHAGICFEPENESDFLEKLNLLLNNSTLYVACQTGCEMLARDFDRKFLARQLLDILQC